MKMHVKPLVVSPYEENCYLVWNKETAQGVVIDPGDEALRISAAIKAEGFEPLAILLTHAHSDHIGAVDEIRDEFNIPVYIGKGEEDALDDPQKNLSIMSGLEVKVRPADHLVEDGQSFELAGMQIEVSSTPGHSPASVCYHCGDVVFCGDIVFMGSIGRTDLPGCHFPSLMNSIATKILTLPDETILYPGHGPMTTVGREREFNPFLQGNAPTGS